ncbi:hypothetical protein CRUP_017497, partial [Coryphaenoides rupestris]
MAVLLGGFSAALAVTSVFVAFLTYFTYRLLTGHLLLRHRMKSIPEIGRSLPIIGHALLLKRNPGEEFRNVPLVKVWIGTMPMLMLYHAETVETLLNNTVHMDKADVYSFLHPWLGTGLLT